ncbi:MAG: septum formation protein Maf [Pirellulales bacterium]|nr:septum formation protein Maf [Pirellulales bacterium]
MNAPPLRLILASKSPRRRQLLADAGYTFIVHPADDRVESGVSDALEPDGLVRELAYRKAADVAARFVSAAPDAPRAVVLGCDTIVECQGQMLGKPADRADARRMLQVLRGQEHRVISGLCLWPTDQGEPLVDVASTTLRTDPLGNEQLDEYLAGDDWRGKAGAFGYQDRPGWVHVVEGSESNVVGLPLELLATMLGRLGF